MSAGRMVALRHGLLAALLLISLVHGGKTGATEPEAADPAKTERVDRLFAKWDKPDTPGASVAVIKDGKIIHSRGYGQASLEESVPNTPSTVFHLASISKQFTAFAIQLLAHEGKLSLDDD